MDPTESFRREAVAQINSEVESNDEDLERARLEKLHGKVYNTQEVQAEFDIEGFIFTCYRTSQAKSKISGTMEFQHSPRFYFNFRPT